jgi:FKBP-type peptidyl-prolyl cis-trans isomerase (trigger factor)
LASYHIAYQTAKQKKPHTIGEELVKPAAINMVHITCGDDTAKKTEQVPLSQNTIDTHIYNMSNDIKQQVIKAIKMIRQFSLQLDERTNESDNAQLIACVHYPGLKDMEEEFLFCQSLTTTTTGEDILKKVD